METAKRADTLIEMSMDGRRNVGNGAGISRRKGGIAMSGYSMALNSVYNHYLTTYASKSTSRYDTHKKSELRDIYNSIVKMNREAPLCMIDTSQQAQQFAIDIKENARLLRNTIASLGGLDEEELLQKKIAYSSNEDLVEARYIGTDNNPSVVLSFDLSVEALAQPQTNMGNFLPSQERTGLPADSYSFDVGINDLNYEFQFQIGSNDTNLDLQNRLTRLVNNAGIGLTAEVLEDGEGNSALVLRSSATGLAPDRAFAFQVSDRRTSRRAGTVGYLGLDEMTGSARNASFTLNGVPHTSPSNTFSVEQTYEVTLRGVSRDEGDTARIGLKTDIDSLSENIRFLIGGYNTFLEATSRYHDTHPKSNSLLAEMAGVSFRYRDDMEALGLQFAGDGTISMDPERLRSAIDAQEDGEDVFDPIRQFTHSILQKTRQVSLDPMKYVDRTLVAYKNPGRSFSTPYITSAYSGMLFNSYC